MYRRLIRLKWTNTDLKVLIAVGGWTAGSGKFSDMVHNEQMRRNFVLTSVKYLRKYGFDGLGQLLYMNRSMFQNLIAFCFG